MKTDFHKNFQLIWSVVGLIAVLTVWFLPWRFQVNDDVIMMWLVSGAYTGEPETYAVFIHPILSWAFSEIYSTFPSVPIYPLTWFLVVFLSYLGLVLCLDRAKMSHKSKNILSAFCLCLFLHFVLFLQFTVVAGVAGFSGLILWTMWIRERNKALLLLSIVLITFSVLIRWESFALISLAFGFYLLSFKPTKAIPSYLNLFLIPFILFLGLVGSKTIWEAQSEYADFVEYNKARAAVSDHPVSYRLVFGKKLDRDPMWFYFSQWMMEDDKVSVEELRERKAELDTAYFSLDQLGHSFTRLASVMSAEAFKSVFSLILLVFYFYGFRGTKKSLTFMISWILFFLLFNHFFVLNGRVVILFFLPFLFPLLLEETRWEIRKWTFAMGFSTLLLLFGYHLFSFFREAKGRMIMQQEFLALTAEIPENSLLVLEGYKENYLETFYTIDRPVPFLSLGWVSKSPFQKKKLRKSGLDQVSDTDEFYLLGVDINDEYFFPEYMNYVSGGFRLVDKTELDNFILFHYTKSH